MDFRPLHCCNKSLSLLSLSEGSLTIRSKLSSSMPKKVMQVEGPSVLSFSRETPSTEQVSIIVFRFSSQELDVAGPTACNKVVQVMKKVLDTFFLDYPLYAISHCCKNDRG